MRQRLPAAMVHVLSALAEELHRTQHFLPGELREYQYRLLEKVVRHARAHVPFYRDTGRLDPLFRRNDSIDWDRWPEIPLLTRQEVQRAGEALRSEYVPAEHGMIAPIATSGSTAEPVTVWHSQYSNVIVRAAVVVRNLKQNGIDPTQRMAFLYPFTPAHFDTRRARRHSGRYDSFSEPGLTGERFDVADTRPTAELVQELVSIRPKFLRAQPIVLELLCANDTERLLSDLAIAVVFSVGEHLPADVKQEVADHLGCWIIDSYGSIECGRMAHSCPECGRFHIEADTVFVEVNDDEGMPSRPADAGWVVATPLHNYAMPLIRYDHVDRAVVGEPGGCSIALPALDAVLGKERDAFVFRGGVSIRPTLPMSALIQHLGAQAFQVAQVAEDRCEVRIVPGRLPPSEMCYDSMTRLIRSTWWSELNVDYKIVSELPRRSARGKVAAYVQEMPHARRLRSGRG